MSNPLAGLKVAKMLKEVGGKAGKAVRFAKRLEKFDRRLESIEEEGELGLLVSAITEAGPASVAQMPVAEEYASVLALPSVAKMQEEGIETLEGVGEILGVDITVENASDLRKQFEELLSSDPTSFRVFVPHLSKLAEMEQAFHEFLDDRFDLVITAKKVEYLLDSEYVPGIVESVPKIGSVARISHKLQLGEQVSRGEMFRAAQDGAFIIEMAAGALGQPQVASGAQWVRRGLENYERLEPVLGERFPSLSLQDDLLEVPAIEESHVENWLNSEVEVGRRITPGDLSGRFKEISPHLAEYFRHCCLEHEDMGRLFEKRLKAIADARDVGPGAVQSELRQAKKNLAGRFAEQLATDALEPFFEDGVVAEVEEAVGARSTRIDRLFRGAKAPIVGKGGLYVPEDGTLAVESKAGTARYISGQAGHLDFQTTGANNAADGSMVITTRDIRELPAEVESQLRDDLRENALIYKFFPGKSELDEVILKALEEAADSANVAQAGES